MENPLMNALATAPYTAEDLLALPDEKRFELVDGDLVETNVSTLSSWVGGRTYRLIAGFVEDHGLGVVWPADCGLQCFADDPHRVRKPDTMFIDAKRYPLGQLSEGYLREVPDLVVEVLSPNDKAVDIDRKVGEYLDAGIRLVWVILPEAHTVRVHRGDGSGLWLKSDGELSGEDVIPGFRCRVADLFPVPVVAAVPGG